MAASIDKADRKFTMAGWGSRASLDMSGTAQTEDIIDRVVEQHGRKEWFSPQHGITRDHWQSKRIGDKCFNTKCRKKLTLNGHHCRKCGNVFCAKCLKFKRRLNLAAQLDPAGKLYKVCEVCFDHGPQTLGQTRSHMEYIKQMHAQKRRQSEAQIVKHKSYETEINIRDECTRLKDGFLSSSGSTVLKHHLEDIKGIINKPDWMRCRFWTIEKLVERCRKCYQDFNLRRSRHHCCVCGAAVCESCSSKDLLVYIPDSQLKDKEKAAELKIIKIVGCPDKEPTMSQYLRVCEPCEGHIADQQYEEYYQDPAKRDPNYESWFPIINIHEKLSSTRKGIDDIMPKYQEIVESLDINDGSAKSSDPGFGNTRELARMQCDLADYFSKVVMNITPLKKIRTTTPGQVTVVKNMVRGASEFYLNNMFSFRDLQRRLEETTPKQVLVRIQNEVEKNAVNGSYMIVKQAAMESLHLSSDGEGVEEDADDDGGGLGSASTVSEPASADQTEEPPPDPAINKTRRGFWFFSRKRDNAEQKRVSTEADTAGTTS